MAEVSWDRMKNARRRRLKQAVRRIAVLGPFLVYLACGRPRRTNFSQNTENSLDEPLKLRLERELRTSKREFDAWELSNRVSVVLVSWKRRDNIQRIVTHLEGAENVGEILIWNNDATHLHAIRSSKHNIRIHEGHTNLNTLARWRACGQLAQFPVCYFIDDDFLPDNFNLLYFAYQQDPTRLHAATYVKTVWNDLRWGILDRSVRLHTAFSWLGHGSAVENFAQRFLERLSSMSAVDIAICDNAFFMDKSNPGTIHDSAE